MKYTGFVPTKEAGCVYIEEMEVVICTYVGTNNRLLVRMVGTNIHFRRECTELRYAAC